MKYILLFFLFVTLVFAVGCEKAECQTAADCVEQPGKTASCTDGKCFYSVVPNLCGNGLCEKSAAENVCSCPGDCKTPKCEGKYKIETSGARSEDARVLTLYCDETKKCMIGVKTQTPRYLKEIDRETAFGKLKMKIDYKEPMDLTKKDVFSVTMQMIELEPDVVKERGLEVYQISFFSKDRLAEKGLNNVFLKELRVPRKIEVPLSITKLLDKELVANVAMRIDYGYTRRDKISATEFKDTPKTGTIEYDLPDRVSLIESGELP